MKQQVYEEALKRIVAVQEAAMAQIVSVAGEPPTAARVKRALAAALDGHVDIAKIVKKALGK